MESPFKSKNGLERIAKAAGYSIAGLKAAYRNEAAIRQETWLMLVLIPLGFYLGQTNIERILLVGVTLLVFVVELLNSAIEAAVDHTSIDHHALAARAKDIGSAAVMMAIMLFLLVWALILFG
ncbi:MAG TPA: diacylglycerol kinase [Methylotenera sp.]|nr:diacylglycerol kinase [Methylotenera sp.]HPV44853.1 diacylglycerol kinase [Methylotenera sp.]